MQNKLKPTSLTFEEQLDFWQKGSSYHDNCGICCPDYSCCYPELLTPQRIRYLFVRAVKRLDRFTIGIIEHHFFIALHLHLGENIIISNRDKLI